MYKKRGCTCKVVRNINHIIRFWWSRNRRRRRILNSLQYYSNTAKCVEAPWPLSGGLLWGNSAINSIDRKQKRKRKKVAYSVREFDWQHQWYVSVGWGERGYSNPGIWSKFLNCPSDWTWELAVSDDFCFYLSFHFFHLCFLVPCMLATFARELNTTVRTSMTVKDLCHLFHFWRQEV